MDGDNMRVLLVNQAIPPYIIDGGIHVYDLARGLAKRGYEVHLLLERKGSRSPQVPFDEYPWEGFVAHQVVPIIKGLDWTSYMMLVGRYVKKLHEKYHFDVIHGHGPDAGFLLYYRPNTRVVTTVHGAYLGEYLALKKERMGLNIITWTRIVLGARLYTEIEKVACKRSDAVITVTPKDKPLIVKSYGIAPHKVHVIPNGVDVEYLKSLANRYEFDLSAERPWVLFVGRLAPRKGLLDLLHAWRILKEKMQCKGSLLIAGSGELLSIVKLYAQKNLNIIYLSLVPRGKLMKIYEESDIFVLPSLFEGLPYTLLEAIAFSKPLLISKYLGLQDVLKDYEYFADPKNVWEFATKLRMLLEDEKLRKYLSEKVSRLIPFFSLENMVGNTIKVYHTILSKR
jgi:glycosyltransferase involved in cell wall biosynthesis